MSSTLPTDQEIEEVERLLEEAQATGSTAAAQSAQRLSVCVKIGTRLMEWKKKIPRGEWEDWLAKHFPEQLPDSTRRRWMRLAKLAKEGRLDVESARGLRHAYQLGGLLPDTDSSNAKGSSAPESYVVHIARLVAALQHIDVNALDVRQRNEIRHRLAPVLAFRDRLG